MGPLAGPASGKDNHMVTDTVVQFRDDRAQRLTKALAEPPQITLRDQLLKLKRRRWIILGTVAVVMAATLVTLFRLTPIYSATTDVMLQPAREKTLDIESVVSGLPPDVEAIQGELSVIQSRVLAAKVIDKLHLDRMGEFNPEIEALEGSTFNPVTWAKDGINAIGRGMAWMFGAKSEPPKAAGEDSLRTKIINNFLQNLSAVPRGRSRVVEITFLSRDPELAAAVANAVGEQYITEQLDAKYEATERATKWLNERLAALREKTEGAERVAESFRAKSGLLRSEEQMTLAADQMGKLNAELIVLKGVSAEAEAKLRAATSARGGNIASMPMVILQSTLIQNLQQQQVELHRQLADLSENLGDKHPQIIQTKAQITELNGRIRTEMDKVISALRNDVMIARQREAVVSGELEKMKVAAGASGGNEVQLRSMESDANASRLLLNTLTQRFNETSIQHDLQQADARIISPAPTPQMPAYPNKTMIMGLALFFSLVLGVVLAMIAEHLDQGFRSSEQMSQATGLPALGLIPRITEKRGVAPADYFLTKPRSAYGEAISGTIASLFLTSGERRPRSIMVTSSMPDEGKSTTAVNLARAVSQSGLRTLLVDGDLRRPTLHTLLGLPLQPGLVEYLQDRASFEDIVRRDPKSEVDFIPAGGQVANPLHFLAADKTRAFLQGLSKYYDFIIIDSSPVMAVSDPRVLGRYVDDTLFVVRWAQTRREHVMHGVKQLIESGVNIGGTILSLVDAKQHADYSFGDSGKYHMNPKYYER